MPGDSLRWRPYSYCRSSCWQWGCEQRHGSGSPHNNIDGASQPSPEKEHIAAGDRGTTVTRLAPGGKVMLNGKTYEAKSIDVYIDPHREVEVIGFDNFTVVVKPLSRSAEEEA